MRKRKPDVIIRREGSISLLAPSTKAGREWMDEHLPEDAQHWGTSTVVEWRYVDDILNGMREDGLAIGEDDGSSFLVAQILERQRSHA